MAWTPAIALDRISRDRKAVVKLGARQIALFEANGAITPATIAARMRAIPCARARSTGAC
jgi:hypothetical protein